MDYDKSFDKLSKYEGNGRVIFLNPENNHWVRMEKEKFDIISGSKVNLNKLLQTFNQKYDLFGIGQDDCNIRSVYFAVTRRCNLQCTFCTMNSSPYVSTENDLSVIEIQEMLIPKLKEILPRRIIITGGEPTMREDILDILKSFAEAFGKSRLLLQSNGLLMTEDFIRRVAPYVMGIEISIENIFEESAVLMQMKKLFQCIREEKLELSLSFVLDDKSRQYLWEAVELCHSYKGLFTLRIVTLVGRATQETYKSDVICDIDVIKVYYEFFSYLLEQGYVDDRFISGYMNNLQPKKACGAYGKILSIHPDGTTYMCGNFKSDDFSMGNIRNKSMSEICEYLNNKLRSSAIKNKFLVDNNAECKHCPVKYFCPGPCRAELEESGTKLGGIDSKCISKKAMLRYNLFYYDKDRTEEENLKEYVGYLKDILDGNIQFT